jgi:glycosyltransferase involved in cell wall biosynthesis
MAQGFGVADKPFTVLECAYTPPVYNSNEPDSSLNPDGKKVIFYAGALRDEYGAGHLLRAFSMIKDPDYRLWLAGGGNAEPMIREYAAKDPRIEFLGFVTPQEVDKRQKNATALISPRTSELEFVKYSFPSKTMECLTSGKPYIAHKLPCDPPEYGAHIQYAENESDEALRDKIVEVCEMPKEQRDEIAARAKQFVYDEKNPKAMCKRVVELWEKVLN